MSDGPRGETTETDEAPKAIYQAACARIAEAFADQGFGYSKSGPRFSKREGDLSFEIYFQGDRYNAWGHHVGMLVHVLVTSKHFGQWLREKNRPWSTPLPGPARVGGGQIGNLRRPFDWIKWNLANPAERDATINEVISTIRTVALPYFDLRRSPESVMSDTIREIGSPLLDLEYALCFLGRDAAMAVGRWHLRNEPKIYASYPAALAALRRDGLPSFKPNGYVQELALFSAAEDLVFSAD